MARMSFRLLFCKTGYINRDKPDWDESKTMSDIAEQQTPGSLAERFVAIRKAHKAMPYASYQVRIERLDKLKEVILAYRSDIAAAVAADFGHRSHHETDLLEIFPILESIRYAKKSLKSWMKPRKRKVGQWFLPAKAKILHQPLGVVGIIVPWNYPLFLAVAPLISALSAGNRVMIKMSEHTPATASLFAEMILRAFKEDEVAVVTGGAEVGMAFSQLAFNHLLFTGSTQVGRHVMHAASDHLTPVTLELGGKSPAIVGLDYSIDKAVESIMLGKCVNAGQTCIAPDYVFIPESSQEAFVSAARAFVAHRYPDIEKNPDFSSIINERQRKRLKDLLMDAQYRGGHLVSLEGKNAVPTEGKKLAPVLVLNASNEMRLLKEEIFGPILPVLTYKHIEEVVTYVNSKPNPLALYYFSDDKESIDFVLYNTLSGGVTINDTLLHIAQDDLPFGGVGASGMGHYRAEEGFATFSQKRAIFYQAKWHGFKLLYPPYGKVINRLLEWMIK